MKEYRSQLSEWKNKGYNIDQLDKMYRRWVDRRNKNLKKALMIIVPVLIVVIIGAFFWMNRTYNLSVNIKDYKGNAKKNEEVKIYKGSKLIKSIKTDSRGKAELSLTEGSYIVKAAGKTDKVTLNKSKSVIFKTANPKKPKYVKSGLNYLRVNNKGYYEYKNKKDGSTLVYIPAGKFTMGSNDGGNDEDPVHTVYLDGYYISKYEITNKQYKQFCDATGRSYPKDPGFNGMSNYFTAYPNYPVVNVSWNDAKAYCDWAGLKLPTEAQWEKGARGTDARKYPWGTSSPTGKECNYADQSLNKYKDWDWIDKTVNDGFAYTSPVGSYKRGQSPYGLMDMAGNVWEWCSDWYDSDYYSNSPSSNPEGPSSGKDRVLRGGSWLIFLLLRHQHTMCQSLQDRSILLLPQHRFPPRSVLSLWLRSSSLKLARR